MKAEKTEKIISIRLNESEIIKFSNLAKEAQMPISSFFKQSALNSLIIKPNKDLNVVIYNVNRIGNNLNQIAHKVNSNFYDNAESLLSALQDIEFDLNQILVECGKW